MWFVVNISGKQEIIRINQLIDVDNIKAKNFDVILLNRIMLIVNDYNNIQIGKPFLKAKIQAIIIQKILGKKILVLRFKRKKHYKKIKGFRMKKTRMLVKKLINYGA